MKLETGSKIRRHGDQRERAILVGLVLPDRPTSYQEPLEELERLADTAGADTLERVLQRRDRPDPKTFIGKGKVEEVRQLAGTLEADLVIVDHDLSPSQGRNLEKALGGTRVIDRTELILDIFVRRASSAMAKAQVELAQMEYSLPRLKRLWTHLNREVGGGRVGIGVRGPGEKQIETDRRLVRKRIRDLQEGLETMEAHKLRQTHSRGRWFTVCLVGYTNAGKSSVLRALTGAGVFVQDRLFATLDTTTRAWEVAPGKRVFLSDTVGFIRDLPHHLVSCFQATLEEARTADLLLHVVDAADPDAGEHVQIVEETLHAIGAGGVPRIAVLNQIDRVGDALALRLLEESLPSGVRTSAKTGEGLAALAEAVYAYVLRRHQEWIARLAPGEGRLLARLRALGEVLDVDYGAEEVAVRLLLAPSQAERLATEGVRIEAAPEGPHADPA
jgi:GTP-binding protein HflX